VIGHWRSIKAMHAKNIDGCEGGAQGSNVELEGHIGYGDIELSIAYVATSQTLTWTLGV
jgi:hypothetical protein